MPRVCGQFGVLWSHVIISMDEMNTSWSLFFEKWLSATHLDCSFIPHKANSFFGHLRVSPKVWREILAGFGVLWGRVILLMHEMNTSWSLFLKRFSIILIPASCGHQSVHSVIPDKSHSFILDIWAFSISFPNIPCSGKTCNFPMQCLWTVLGEEMMRFFAFIKNLWKPFVLTIPLYTKWQ